MDDAYNGPDRLRNLLSDRSAPSAGGEKRGVWRPLGDLRQTASDYTLFIDLPGIDEDEILISYKEGLLSVAGERDFDHDKEDAEEFTRIDRPYGKFHYEIALDGPVNYDLMSAKYKRGVLKVQVPRVRRNGGRTLEVN